MAAGEEVDAELTGRVQRRLLGLPRDQRVVSLVRGLEEPGSAAPGDDGDARDLRGAFGEDERLAIRRRAETRCELVDGDGFREAGAGADAGELSLARRAELRCEQRV